MPVLQHSHCCFTTRRLLLANPRCTPAFRRKKPVAVLNMARVLQYVPELLNGLCVNTWRGRGDLQEWAACGQSNNPSVYTDVSVPWQDETYMRLGHILFILFTVGGRKICGRARIFKNESHSWINYDVVERVFFTYFLHWLFVQLNRKNYIKTVYLFIF